MTDDVLPPIAAELRQRLDALCAEGWDLWSTFDVEVRQDRWHPFIAADYTVVQDALERLITEGGFGPLFRADLVYDPTEPVHSYERSIHEKVARRRAGAATSMNSILGRRRAKGSRCVGGVVRRSGKWHQKIGVARDSKKIEFRRGRKPRKSAF